VGLTTTGVATLLVLGLLLGTVRWFHEETTTVAATGLIVLTTGFSTQDQVLLERLYDTGIGIGVGLVVNLLVWPPMRDFAAVRAIDSIGGEVGRLLLDIAYEVEERGDPDRIATWVDRTRELDEDIDRAWALLRQAKESGRLNLRRAARAVKQTDISEGVLRGNEQAVAETRSMARTLGHGADNVVEWEPEFRNRWLALLAQAGESIVSPERGSVADVRAGLHDLAHDLSDAELSGLHWPEYGALITNLRNVAAAMEPVARNHPIEIGRYVRRDRLTRRMQHIKG
jgi:hypothetical protein